MTIDSSTSRLLGLLLLLPLTLGAQTSAPRPKQAPRPEIRSVVITVETQDANGRTHKVQKRVSEPDIKLALGVARSLLFEGMKLASEPTKPIYRIFYCGGDITKSDGTCSDVIAKCETFKLKFNCEKEDPTGTCTSGGC